MLAPRRLLGLLLASVAFGAVAACDADPHRSAAAAPSVALAGHRGTPGEGSWTPWPQALHDARHSGAATVAGPRTGHVRWRRDLGGNVTPGPVIAADGTVYAATNAGVLHALDPRSGMDRWRVDEHAGYGLDTSTSPAVLPDGLVLWPGPNGNLIAVDPAGEVLWRLHLGGLVSSPAVLADGSTVVGTSGGLLVGLRPTATGPGEVWRVDLGEQSYGSPVLTADGATAYQSVTSGVVAVSDGKVRWRATPASRIVEVSPALAPDGTVVVGANDHRVYGLDPADGSTRWSHDLGFTTYSSPGVSADGLVYLGDHGNRLTGLDVRTGDVRWRVQGSRVDDGPGGIGVWTSVLLDARHTAYAGTRQGLVYAADRTGRILWTLDTGATVDSYPALTGDGGLVIGSSNGTLLLVADH